MPLDLGFFVLRNDSRVRIIYSIGLSKHPSYLTFTRKEAIEMAFVISNFLMALASALQFTDGRHSFLPSFHLEPR